MKILTNVVTLERVGGMEVQTLEVGRALAARGHEIHIAYGHELGDGTLPDMRADFEAAGITVHGPYRFSPPSLVTAVPSVVAAAPAAAMAARIRPDVVWLQRFEHMIWAQLSARRSRAPVVCHLHHALQSRLIPLAATGVRQFIAVSEFMRSQWVERGLDPERVEVLHNAVPSENYPYGGEVERARARRELGLPADAAIALFYGRLEESKGLRVALDAWERAEPALDRGHLVLAGVMPPSDRATLGARVDDVVRSGHATVLPIQSDVVPLLHAADLVLFPSQLPEAFGRVALEGLMTGRPVLASSVGGVPEILTGPLAHLLIPPADVTSYAKGIETSINWRRDDPELGARCAAIASDRFSFSSHVDRLEEILERSRARRHRRG